MKRLFPHFHPHVRGLAFAFVAMVIVAPVALLGYIHITDVRSEDALQQKKESAQAIAKGFQEQLNVIKNLGITLGLDGRFQNAVQDGNWQSVNQLLEEFTLEVKDPFIDRVFVSDAKGNEEAAVPSLVGGVGNNFSFRDWYLGALRTKEPYLSEVYKRTAIPQNNVATLAIPFFDKDQQVQVILAIQLNLAFLLDWSNSINANRGGSIYIVDQKGQIVISPEFSLDGPISSLAQVQAVQDLIQGQTAVMSNFSNPFVKEKLLAALEPISEYHWGVIVQQPTRYALAPDEISQVLRNGVIFLAGGLLVALFWIGSRH